MTRQIPWLRVFVEGVVIVGSILLAFGIEGWGDERTDRALEEEYLGRLIDDLRADTSTFGFVHGIAVSKEAWLNEVTPFLVDPSRSLSEITPFALNASVVLTDTAAFLQTLVDAASLGWQEPRARRATFDELRSTGNLRLIRGANLRGQITAYHQTLDDTYRRIDRRRGTYPVTTYHLIPRGVRDDGDEFVVANDLMGESRASLVRAIRDSSLRREAIAERNFASFTKREHALLTQSALSLLQSLESAIPRDD